MRQIVQIIPADGWDALYGAHPRPVPLVAWAHIDEGDGITAVVGLVVDQDEGEVTFAYDLPGFVTYERRR